MIENKDEKFSEADNSLVIREDAQKHLPSAEVRELVPELQDEIDLRDYLDTLIRRKTAILSVALIVFILSAFYTFLATPQFKAKGTIRASAQNSSVTKFDNLESNVLQTREFQQTQVNLLQSNQLANRVIDKLDLTNNPVFNPQAGGSEKGNQSMSFLDPIKNFIRSDQAQDQISVLQEDAQSQLLAYSILGSFHKRLNVAPVKNSELVEITFSSPDPALASSVTNAAMDEFIQMHMDSNLDASKTASKFLEKQIRGAQIKLEESELQLNEFARKIGIVSLNPEHNLVMKQLEEVNNALAKASSDRISKEAMYKQNMALDEKSLDQVVNNVLIQSLKTQYSTLEAEYRDLSVTFKAGYPKLQQLQAKMDEISARITKEKQQIINSIKNTYETALKTEQYLIVNAELQKGKALELGEKSTQYKILEREVDTNKSIYQSLLQRSKEIEATVGAAVTNIQIIDRATTPLFPFKPQVAKNLLLALVLGLMLGVGTAFTLEAFDNTIKNPDELADRFHIPVLGLIPYDKESIDNRMKMAMKSFDEPRSPVAEAFRTTMTSVRLSVADNPPKTILLTSILPGAGKSSLATNTAFSYLAEEERCLIIDVDLRKPSLHKIFQTSKKKMGLSSVLSGMAKLDDVITKTEYAGLDYICSGPLPPNPAELLSSKRMRQLLAIVSQHYDRVILDGPPYQGFAEILVLSHMVDGVILVAVEGETPREGVKHFRKAIVNVGGRILGAIINKSGRKKGFTTYGSYKYYAYNYKYGEENAE
ncbi:MAG: polysaccharide biosynthesis tyrosine autokinase [Proteobacteria bacterium]|nr:polysaccharide biosynthesis tyrosine autokinase [Desulfocapsa sp.]MBU3943865.1 polysaccharide biosynthesis tyrosine autokinase [Pseudomonadota bacterium]MBU4027986.1 polysaccharide biosynthesis tyrosine autokinase [Pseudomonadota bacterium]MBU4041457.1 polysaccharide biosynthesis tyrosine autokinase [Pseudomonadota bacterium]MBU4166318.1 polysaccharide biosynthesis tyrosine autokinase [Pseudomonadota bacterium]